MREKAAAPLLLRGGLFNGSIHIVNTSGAGHSQPKRFTLWEIHPITAVLVCERPDRIGLK